VLAWTGGQPFLTQKVCKLVLSAEEMIPEGNEAVWVENVVRTRIIENWETQDEPEHLRTVRDRIIWSDRKEQLLQLYQQILQTSLAPPDDGGVKANDKPEHMELRLSGLVVKRQGKLRVYNRIYASVFDQSWVENALAEAGLLPKLAEKLPPSRAEIQALEQAAVDALQQFESQEIEALLSAMQGGQALKALVGDGCLLQDYPTVSPLLALQTILSNIRQRNQFESPQGMDYIYDVCFSPDGQQIVMAEDDGTVQFWDLSGQLRFRWKGHQGSVRSVSFSPDGQLIATAGGDGTARLWNLSGQQIAQFEGHQRSVWSVSFSPDGQLIATAGGDGTARLWNLLGQQIAQFDGHQDLVRRVSFSPDGQCLATAGYDGTARLWNLSGQQLAQLNGHIVPILGISFSPDGQRLVTAGVDGARLWDLSKKPLAQWNSHHDRVWSVSFSSDGQHLATVGADSSIRLWNLRGKQLAQFNGHQGWVRRVSFSPEGQRLATAGYDGTVRLWNLEGQQIVLNGHRGRVNSVSFSPNGLYLATAGEDGTVRLWNLEGQQLSQLNNHQGRVYDVSFSPDGQRLATAGADGKVRLWNIEGKLLLEFQSHRRWVYSMSFSPDGHCIATGGGADGTVRLWNLSGYELAQWQSHRGTVYCISFHPNGQQIATAGEDSMAKLWDLSGRQLAQWQSPNNSVYSVVSFSPDGQCLAMGGTGGLQIWRIGGLDELLVRGCDWLKDYVITHPEALEKLEVCQDRLNSIEVDRNLVGVGEVEGGLGKPIPKENALFQKVPELRPSLDSAPKTQLRQLAAKTLVALFGEILSRQGDIEKAVAAYTEAQKLDPTLEIPATVGNNLCWWGSLWGNAAEVMDACETAVALDPENAMFRDSRGLARALTGNIAGAIEDFQAFVDWTDNEKKKLQRQHWIEVLRAGENPFTEEEIESLFNDHNVTPPEALEELEVRQLVTTVSDESEEGFLGEFLVRDKLVKIYQGDITNLVTDVIVSSDDNYLTMSGGVSARIRQVGGDEIYWETRNLIPLFLGDVAVTRAGKLRAKKLFHAVVIDFDEGENLSDKVILRVVHSCMKKAKLYSFRSIAFPLLATGSAGFPAKVVWEIMFRQIIRDLSAENQNISEVIVAIYQRRIVEELKIKNFLEAIEEFG
jgi:WD40 repeat protein/O-acetyl-ADP-ribose deacetylase (regulator of RNase III)